MGGGFSANGVRSNGQNNFLLSGVHNNVNAIAFPNQTSFVMGPSVEAIGEMRVITKGANAEYGLGAGSVVKRTRGAGRTTPLVCSKQNQFGAVLGGPLIKNRTFWLAMRRGDYSIRRSPAR